MTYFSLNCREGCTIFHSPSTAQNINKDEFFKSAELGQSCRVYYTVQQAS